MTVTSETQIANMALDMLKEQPINSFEDNNAAARWMDRNFSLYRDVTLASHPWKFAMTRAILTEDSEAPDFEWGHRYRKPAECIRVLPLRLRGMMNGALIPHEVEGDFILTNWSGPLNVKYIQRVTDISIYNNSPLFVLAVASQLALRMSYWMTGKEAMVSMMKEEFLDIIKSAKHVDSAEGTHANQYATGYDAERYVYEDVKRNSEYGVY